MPSSPLTAVVVGAGHRSLVYSRHSKAHPEDLRIVAVADPRPERRKIFVDEYDLPESACFETAEDVARAGRIADVVINGTMDAQHVPTSVPLVEAGYDILLEKPFATNEEEMWRLVETARRCDRKIMICHVLRYAPFYAAMRQKIVEGAVGRIMNIQTTEHVSYHHVSVGFVRGKWNRKDTGGSTFLMAKCCHDLDLLMWMMSGVAPARVSSFGSRMFFRPENAPEGSGERCLDCAVEADCLYSARKLHLDNPERWRFYVWDAMSADDVPPPEERERSLREDNPHGRCVWKCDNDIVDHQSVLIEFRDGATATHNLVSGTPHGSRTIRIHGTEGEIFGVMEDSAFVVKRPNPAPGEEYDDEVVDLSVGGDMTGAFGGHGGGDNRLVGDFVRFVRGEEGSLSCTTIEDSVHGHLVGFLADRAVEEGRVMDVVER